MEYHGNRQWLTDRLLFHNEAMLKWNMNFGLENFGFSWVKPAQWKSRVTAVHTQLTADIRSELQKWWVINKLPSIEDMDRPECALKLCFASENYLCPQEP